MSRTIWAVLLLILLSRMPNTATADGDAMRQPNVILLIADDLGYGELGCQGNPQIPTPHIDALAESGVRCTQAYVVAPNCSPSRAGLLTGRIPMRFGYEFNPIGARNEDPGTGLPSDETTLAECLHDVGYSTGLIGKWHLGGGADYHPHRHGFDEFFGFSHEGHYFAPSPWSDLTTMLRRKHLPIGSTGRYAVSDSLIYSSHMGHDEPDYDANNPIVRNGQPIVEQVYLTQAFAREAVQFIQRYRSSPFFLAVTFNAVHSPLQARTSTLERFDNIKDVHRRIFAAMLSDLDTAVGTITAAVDAAEIRGNTLIIFISDNGGPTKELTSSNLPLRDGKGSMYEGGLRVPFIVNWPASLPKGEVCTEMVSSLDIFPTVAKLASAEMPNNLDGHDMLPLLADRNAKSLHSALFWRQGRRAALRNGPWKIVSPKLKPSTGDSNRTAQSPALSDVSERVWELYNIDSDIGESRNVATEEPAKLAELQAMWRELNAQMIDPTF